MQSDVYFRCVRTTHRPSTVHKVQVLEYSYTNGLCQALLTTLLVVDKVRVVWF